MFAVRWEETALEELTTAWLQGDSSLRRFITRASHQIDQRLRTDPLAASESRPGGRRVLLSAPLGITFRIEADGRTVSVLRTWVFRKRTP
jgi:hypothetical protein